MNSVIKGKKYANLPALREKFAAVFGRLALAEWTMNSALYQKILKDNV